MTRIVELNRAADYLYHWRLNDDDLAQLYGKAFATLHGTAPLVSRLLHDGRLTFHRWSTVTSAVSSGVSRLA